MEEDMEEYTSIVVDAVVADTTMVLVVEELIVEEKNKLVHIKNNIFQPAWTVHMEVQISRVRYPTTTLR